MQMIKMKHLFSSESLNSKDDVQDGRHFEAKFNLKSKSQLITVF